MLQQQLVFRKNYFHRAEWMMLCVALLAGVMNVILAVVKNAPLDITGYSTTLIVPFALVATGLTYRISNRSERIALALIGAGNFIFFTIMLSMFNYLLLPTVNPAIDVHLAKIDALYGFYWPDMMAWAADHIVISNILKTAYMTTLPQIAILVAILGLTGRRLELHRLLVAVTITGTLAICFWGLVPSLGAKSLYQLPPEIWAKINPPVNAEYAAELIKISAYGPDLISPNEIRGLIAFPSYHVVLALTAMYAARTVKWVFPIFLVLNLLIIPAAPIHGGHHLIDLPAGLVFFLIGLFAGNHIVDKYYRDSDMPHICPAEP